MSQEAAKQIGNKLANLDFIDVGTVKRLTDINEIIAKYNITKVSAYEWYPGFTFCNHNSAEISQIQAIESLHIYVEVRDLNVLNGIAPKLKDMKINFSGSPNPATFLKRCTSLVTLDFDLSRYPVDEMFSSLPSTLKHLTVNAYNQSEVFFERDKTNFYRWKS